VKRADGRGRRGAPAERPEGPYIAIVRRGETAILRMLLEALEAEPGPVQVVWDRRAGNRRRRRRPISPDRRRVERRSPAPSGWLTLGFFFAPSRAAGAAR
jgi:hypothetical protein